MRRIWHKAIDIWHHRGHYVSEWLHVAYFGVLFAESHYFYSYLGGALAVVTVIHLLMGEE